MQTLLAPLRTTQKLHTVIFSVISDLRLEHFRIQLYSQHRSGYRSRYSYSPRAGRSGERIPLRARFSAPVQTGPGATQPPVQWVTGLFRG